MRTFLKSSWALCWLLCTTTLFAQSGHLKIIGLVRDQINVSVPFAGVTIHKSSDSTVVESAFTNEDGTFEATVPSGKHYLEINFLGAANYVMPLSKTNGTIDLGVITLKSNESNHLDEAVIVGEKSQMSLQIDKRIYNVGSDVTSQGASATDVLQNIPSVTVDAEGNVSLRGSQSVRILVDGKVSGFSSSAEALKQLQSDMIDRVEVITNASARYEAEGESGIINIILKKGKKKGFNGSINARTGYRPDNGIGFNGNYRRNKTNLYGALSLNQSQTIGKSHTNQRLSNADTSFYYEQNYKHDRRYWGTNINLGIDYSFDTNNTFTTTFGVRSGSSNNTVYRTYDNYTFDNEYLSHQDRNENNKELSSMFEGTMSYTKNFGKYRGEWKTEISGYHDRDFENSTFTETTTLNSEMGQDKSKANVIEQSVVLKSDLVLPFSEKGKIETGIRGQIRDFDNDFGYNTLLNNEWISPTQFNDRFFYNEKIYAAYVMGSNTFGKLGLQAGLRVENSNVTTEQKSEGFARTRNYLNFFPSLALSYKLHDVTSFQLSYSRRINRPGQWFLMPFMKFGDTREMRVGNPMLAPELTGSYEASMLNTWQNGSLLAAVYYRHTKDKITNIAFLGDDGIIYKKFMNIASRDAMGLELNGNYSPTKWLRLTTGFNFFKEKIKGSYLNQNFDMDNFSWTNRTSINVTLKPNWRMQLSGNYEAPTLMPQGKRLASYFMDFGLSKDFMKGKATLAFNLIDILNSRKWHSSISTPEIQSDSYFQWRTRSARLVFTYRFNQVRKANPQENIIDNSGGGGGE